MSEGGEGAPSRVEDCDSDVIPISTPQTQNCVEIQASWESSTSSSFSTADSSTGYRIDYIIGGGSSGSQTVSGGSTKTFLVTGLLRQATYTLSVTATSEHLFSTTLTVDPIKLSGFMQY